MKKLILIFALTFITMDTFAQEVYYRKVPKLIPQADGSFRVADGEYDFVPVSKDDTRKPGSIPPDQTAVTDPSQTPVELSQNKSSLGKSPQQPVISNLPKEDSQNSNKAVGARPYLSAGISVQHSTVYAEGKYLKGNASDMQPAGKLAFGAWLSDYVRTEIFWQYHNRLEDHDTYGSIYSETRLKMQDIGFNAFLYANPQDKTKVFIGAGLAATRLEPTIEFNGYDINYWAQLAHVNYHLFESKWCPTFSFFLGVEIPTNDKINMDITGFYSKTNITRDDLKDINTYGLMVNIRFNLPESM